MNFRGFEVSGFSCSTVFMQIYREEAEGKKIKRITVAHDGRRNEKHKYAEQHTEIQTQT
jgi:hypothetical protein